MRVSSQSNGRGGVIPCENGPFQLNNKRRDSKEDRWTSSVRCSSHWPCSSRIYIARWWTALSRSRSLPPGALDRAASPGLTHTAIGFITNFFDTLGIGSFATTTTIYKLRRLVPDERIPGTHAGRSYAARGGAGVRVHQRGLGRSLAARPAHHRDDGWRLARRGRRIAAAAARDSAHHGHRPVARRGVHDDGDAESLSGRRQRAQPHACAPHRGARRQLRPGNARDARHRQLRTEPGALQPARHGAPRGVSDHDGVGSVHGDGRRDAIRDAADVIPPPRRWG